MERMTSHPVVRKPLIRGRYALRTLLVGAVALMLAMPIVAAQENEEEERGCAVTPGGWGAPPSGNNPGQLLHDNFDAVFGDELVVGHLVFEDAQEVTDAMPYEGPGSAFLSHAVALKINLAFGAAGLLDGTLQDVVVDLEGNPYDGWTAQEVLAEAERILVEDGPPGAGEHSDLIDAMTGLNEQAFGCNELPRCPPGLTATALANGDIELSWLAVVGADSYNIYRAVEEGEFTLLDSTTETTYTDTATMVGVTYRYIVTSVEGERESIECDEVEATAIPFFGTAVVGALALVGGVAAMRYFRRK